MVVARCRWVQIGTSGIQIAVGWRGVVGARGWPWFCSPSSRSPSLRISEFWLSGGVGSLWVGSNQHKWDSDRCGLVGMDLRLDRHKWDSENGSVLVFLFFSFFFGVSGYGFW